MTKSPESRTRFSVRSFTQFLAATSWSTVLHDVTTFKALRNSVPDGFAKPNVTKLSWGEPALLLFNRTRQPLAGAVAAGAHGAEVDPVKTYSFAVTKDANVVVDYFVIAHSPSPWGSSSPAGCSSAILSSALSVPSASPLMMMSIAISVTLPPRALRATHLERSLACARACSCRPQPGPRPSAVRTLSKVPLPLGLPVGVG